MPSYQIEDQIPGTIQEPYTAWSTLECTGYSPAGLTGSSKQAECRMRKVEKVSKGQRRSTWQFPVIPSDSSVSKKKKKEQAQPIRSRAFARQGDGHMTPLVARLEISQSAMAHWQSCHSRWRIRMNTFGYKTEWSAQHDFFFFHSHPAFQTVFSQSSLNFSNQNYNPIHLIDNLELWAYHPIYSTTNHQPTNQSTNTTTKHLQNGPPRFHLLQDQLRRWLRLCRSG